MITSGQPLSRKGFGEGTPNLRQGAFAQQQQAKRMGVLLHFTTLQNAG
jgi:hypothetical protein